MCCFTGLGMCAQHCVIDCVVPENIHTPPRMVLLIRPFPPPSRNFCSRGVMYNPPTPQEFPIFLFMVLICHISQQRRRSTFDVFFLERASTSNFCCATNQNNPHILKYVSYDRSRLLQPCGKLFSWAPPVPLGKFYPLAPPPPRNFH